MSDQRSPKKRPASRASSPTKVAVPRTPSRRAQLTDTPLLSSSHSQSRSRSRSSSALRNRRPSGVDHHESIYLGSPQSVRHFSTAPQLPQFRNKLAALSLTASSKETLSSMSSGKSKPGSAKDSNSLTSASSVLNNNFIVFDIGNRFVRAGFAGDSQPRCQVPVEFAWNRVRRKPSAFFPPAKGSSEKTFTSGNEDLDINDEDYEDFYTHWLWEINKIALIPSTDIPPGIQNKNSTETFSRESNEPWYMTNPKKRLECILEIIIRHIFSMELLIDPKSQRIVVMENPLWPVAIKESITKVFLKQIRASSLTFFPSPVLNIVSSGIRSGIVVDIGWEETTISPVYDLRLISNSIKSTIRGSKLLHKKVKNVLETFGKIQEESKTSESDAMDIDLPTNVLKVDFNAVENIVTSCLYEHHDIPIVGKRSGKRTSFPPSMQMSSSSKSLSRNMIQQDRGSPSPQPNASPIMVVPKSMRTTATAESSGYYQPASPDLNKSSDSHKPFFMSPLHHQKQEADDTPEILQFFRINPHTVISISNTLLQHTVAATFLNKGGIYEDYDYYDQGNKNSSLSPSTVSMPFSRQDSTTTTSALSNVSTPSRYQPTFDSRKTNVNEDDDDNELDIPRLLTSVIKSLNYDVKGSAQSHIIFEGGASNIPGLKAKILQDVRKLVAKLDHSVTSPLYIAGTESLGAWVGMSLYLSSLAWFLAQDSHTKLPGEMTREGYLTYGYDRLNPPYGIFL